MYQFDGLVCELFNGDVVLLSAIKLKPEGSDLPIVRVLPLNRVLIIQSLCSVNHVKVSLNRVMFLDLSLEPEKVCALDLVARSESHCHVLPIRLVCLVNRT